LIFSLDTIAEDLSPLSVAILELLNEKDKKPVKGNVAFQKEMFLIANYIDKVNERAEFIPHILGPYSEASEVSIDNLVSMGLVEKKDNTYKITPSGIKVLGLKQDTFSSEEKESIADFKEFISNLTNDEILLFIYASYPNYTVESTEYRRIMKSRVKNSISIYKKGIVSLEKAASLAGVNIETFLDLQRGQKA
jgi:predicted HTH domain antitoxin